MKHLKLLTSKTEKERKRVFLYCMCHVFVAEKLYLWYVACCILLFFFLLLLFKSNSMLLYVVYDSIKNKMKLN